MWTECCSCQEFAFKHIFINLQVIYRAVTALQVTFDATPAFPAVVVGVDEGTFN